MSKCIQSTFNSSSHSPSSLSLSSQLRDADRHHERHQSSAANRSYAELVKWQGHAIRLPLLRLPNDLAPLALECFDCILRYCGDIPLDPELTEVKCVYTVLMVGQPNQLPAAVANLLFLASIVTSIWRCVMRSTAS